MEFSSLESSLDKPEKFLCLTLAGTPLMDREIESLYSEIGDDAIFKSAVENRAESVVAIALQRVFSNKELPAHWSGAIKAVEDKLTLYMAELEIIANRFACESIPVIALKNSGIAKGIYPHLAGCPMGDVDVLVNPKHFRRAHALMLELGYKLDSRSPLEKEGLEEAERDGGAEYTKVLPDGSIFWFELQWRPVAGRWIRPDQEPKAEDLIVRSVSIRESAVRLLAPEDNLLQVCLHTAKHTFMRAPGFRLHTDVDRIVRRCRIDWKQFLAEVQRIGVKTPVYLSLKIPAMLLRTPIPDWVLRCLEEPKWKNGLMLRWIFKAGLFNPDEKKFSKLGYIVFNLMLYDDLHGIFRGIFPESRWMYERYQITSKWLLPFFYLRRLMELTFKRANT